MLTVHGVAKFATEDKYEDGEVGRTSLSECGIDFRAENETTLLEKIRAFFGVERDAIEVNPVGDEPDRVDVSLMECDDSTQPSQGELERWKRGEMRLWSVFYTMRVKDERAYAFEGER